MADKTPFYSHCGVPSHGKGSSGAKKFDAKVNTFYVPGASSTSRPTAKMEPFIHRDNIPCHLLPAFEKNLKTPTNWEHLITKTVLEAEEINDTYYKDEGIKKGEEDDDTAMEDRDFEESSTIMLAMEEGEFEEIKIKLEWDYEEIENSDWAPMARAHLQALKLLVEALKTTARISSRELKALECKMQTGHGPEDARARVALQALVCRFGLVTKAVTFALDNGAVGSKVIETLQKDMNQFHQELEQYASMAEVSNGNILKVLAKMREMSNSQNSEVRARMSHFESAMANFHPGPPSPPTTPRLPSTLQMFTGIQGIDGNTPLGVANVGGSEAVISANYLFNMVRELQAKVDILTERSKNIDHNCNVLPLSLEDLLN